MSEDYPDESDRQPGCLHPRETHDLFGLDAAETAIRTAIDSGRMHHAWLITGPAGTGKATLAYRAARYMLAGKSTGEGLSVDPEDAVSRKIAANAHPNLLVIRRPWDDKKSRWRAEITIPEARRAADFFSKSAGEPGWRIAIIDKIDEMNRNAFNALLKTLEEPPKKGALFLIADSTGALPPTIRSRCRLLTVKPPHIDQTAAWVTRKTGASEAVASTVSTRAHGAPGLALALKALGSQDIEDDLQAIMTALPALDAGRARRFAARMSGKGSEALRAHAFERLAEVTANGARAAALSGDDPEPWVQAWRALGTLFREAEDLYLDPKQAMLSALSRVQSAARESRAHG